MPVLKQLKKEKNFTCFENELLQNENLTYEAKGLLTELISRPKNWKIRKAQLIREHSQQTKIDRIFKELRDNGYLYIHSERCPERNVIVDRYWIISDKPLTKEQFKSAIKSLETEVDFKFDDEFQAPEKKEKSKKDPEIDNRFSEFWEAYPKRNDVKVGKKQCFEWWNKNVKQIEEANKILMAVKIYSTLHIVKKGYAKDPIRFLNHKIYNDMKGVATVIDQASLFSDEKQFGDQDESL